MHVAGEDTGEYFKIVCRCNPTGTPKVRYVGQRSHGAPAIEVYCFRCEETQVYKLTRVQGWEGLPYDPE
jgi:hypothetical protein